MENTYLKNFVSNRKTLTKNYELYYFNDLTDTPHYDHLHNYYEFYFFIEGSSDFVIEGRNYPVSTGDLLVLPPMNHHHLLSKTSNSRNRQFVLLINASFMKEIAYRHPDILFITNHVIEKNEFLVHIDDSAFNNLQARFIHLIEELKSNYLCNTLEGSLSVISLLVYMNRVVHEPLNVEKISFYNELSINLCNYINNNLNGDLSLDTLSSIFFMSKVHISHVFKKQMGISIYQFILQKRLSLGKNCLVSDTPISQVHLQCGFQNYSSFFKAFKKEFGISPKEYQKNHSLPIGFSFAQQKLPRYSMGVEEHRILE